MSDKLRIKAMKETIKGLKNAPGRHDQLEHGAWAQHISSRIDDLSSDMDKHLGGYFEGPQDDNMYVYTDNIQKTLAKPYSADNAKALLNDAVGLAMWSLQRQGVLENTGKTPSSITPGNRQIAAVMHDQIEKDINNHSTGVSRDTNDAWEHLQMYSRIMNHLDPVKSYGHAVELAGAAKNLLERGDATSNPKTDNVKIPGGFGVRYNIFNNNDQVVGKEKFFDTDAARSKFTDKISKADNFHSIEAYSDPRPDEIEAAKNSSSVAAPAAKPLGKGDFIATYKGAMGGNPELSDYDKLVEKALLKAQSKGIKAFDSAKTAESFASEVSNTINSSQTRGYTVYGSSQMTPDGKHIASINWGAGTTPKEISYYKSVLNQDSQMKYSDLPDGGGLYVYHPVWHELSGESKKIKLMKGIMQAKNAPGRHDQVEHGSWAAQNGGGKYSTINPRDKLDIKPAADMLRERGINIDLHSGKVDLAKQETSYNVTDKNGNTSTMTGKEIHKLLEGQDDNLQTAGLHTQGIYHSELDKQGWTRGHWAGAHIYGDSNYNSGNSWVKDQQRLDNEDTEASNFSHLVSGNPVYVDNGDSGIAFKTNVSYDGKIREAVLAIHGDPDDPKNPAEAVLSLNSNSRDHFDNINGHITVVDVADDNDTGARGTIYTIKSPDGKLAADFSVFDKNDDGEKLEIPYAIIKVTTPTSEDDKIANMDKGFMDDRSRYSDEF